ncbi:hypothetical protein CEQ36_18210 [Yersinia intermedia]|nr:hypothetical protein A6J67_05470 [Yersinia sp. FDAARGOS_228]AVL38421.1 hypothetical protein CEQ36_18210 [Yersinia intermedia]OVZ73447.1 hypothetical protein CBW55_20460 [Yersinia intermedia]OWF89074.1 hypothetical protein B4916_18350 [Yersinia intermedia]
MLYPSYFKWQARWLPSFTPVTYWCKLLRICSVAAFLQLELFRVCLYTLNNFRLALPLVLRWM